MPNIRTVQLRDKQYNPVTPYTPAGAVFHHTVDEEGKDVYTNLDNLIGAMDIDRIFETQDEALEEIEEKKQWGLDKIEDEGDSYRNDIDALSGAVQALEEKVFPLTITTSITPNVDTLKSSYKYTVTEHGSVVTGGTVTVTQTKNGGSATSIYSGNEGSKTLTTDVTWGKDVFTIRCDKGTKVNSRTDTRYLCVYGAYGATITTNVIQDSSIMHRSYTSSVSFQPTINTFSGQYIWICVPQYLSITKVTSQGFDVTMNNYVEITVGNIKYRAYRSKEQLQQNTWNLIVS